MAVYNELQVGRYNRFAQKFFSMKGPASVNALISELGFTLALFHGAENRYLEAWDRFQSNEFQGAAAAQNSAIRYRNPVGSNVVAVFESMVIGSEAAFDAVLIQRNNVANLATDLATIVASSFAEQVDARTARQRSLIISTQAAANPDTNLVQVGSRVVGPNTAANSLDLIATENQELPLLPGSVLQLRKNTVNTNFTLSVTWRERQLEESERA